MILKQKSVYYGLFFILLIVILTGCQTKGEHEETMQEEIDSITWINNFSTEHLVKQEDSFQSALLSLIRIYGQDETSASLADTRGYPTIGTSFLEISRKLAEETKVYTTFIELTFDEAKAEITNDHPLISKRIVRGYLEDYVLFVGYDNENDVLMGYSVVSSEPIKVTKKEWDEDYYFLQMNLSLIVADDEASIRQREENSQLYWLQVAVEAILDSDDTKLKSAMTKIDDLGVEVRRADYLRAYYQVFIEQELSSEIEEFLDSVYEAGPTVSHAIEWKFLKEWTLGERESALTYMRMLEQDQKFASSFLATLYIFEEIYTELGEKEMLDKIQEIIAIKVVDPEYLGIPNQ